MGLAASQAKLLSITSRISDNELRSQSITAAKMALASQTTEASRKYINALNTNEFIYRTYDDNGNNIYTALTGSHLTTYAPLRNQYALVNPQGQVLVSELDADNYKTSENVNEFLEKYGIDAIDTGEIRTYDNPGYDEAYKDWRNTYDKWLEEVPDQNNEKYWDEVSSVDNEIYDAVRNSGGCFGYGMSGMNCYMHVLSDLIGVGTHTTSDGNTYEVKDNISWSWNSALHDKSTFEPIIDMLKQAHCSGDVIEGSATLDGENVENIAYEEVPGYGKRLVGGTVSDPNMTLYQRAIDLLWEVHFDYNGTSTGGAATEKNLAKFLYFVEHDLKQAFKDRNFDQDMYDIDYQDWLSQEPPPLDMPATIDEKIYEYSDKDKAQWYVNLWHRMNGESDYKDGSTIISGSATKTEVITNTTTTNSSNTLTRQRWDVLEDGLMNSQDWLKYALESGSISLERVNFTNPTVEGSGLKNATWTSIIYTNALDISEQTDEAAIAKAEAEYEQKTREIENKDKQYDSMLKLLETEHSALTAEHDSIKNVIKSNTDRTLKIYSA